MASTGARVPGEPVAWRGPDGSLLSCREKIAVLRENLAEIRAIAQDALEDALVMEVDEAQFREALREVIDSLENPYSTAKPDHD